MSVLDRFKKDFFYYFAGIIVPGFINAVSIPILKNLLDDANFGQYSLYFNSFTLIVGSLVGWLCQSVIRFTTQYNHPNFFFSKVTRLSLIITGAFSIVAFGAVLYWSHSIMLSALFGIGLVSGGLQNVMIAVSQSNFLARTTLFSESLRTLLYFLTGVLLLLWSRNYFMEKLFISILFSYTVSFCFLIYKNKIPFSEIAQPEPSDEIFDLKKILAYGLPLALWFSCSSLITFIDKPYIAKSFGHAVQGNYQAIYDFIYRGTTIVLAPILTASFPLMTHAFEHQSKTELNRFLKKLLLLESGGLIFAVLAYCLGGYRFLKYILHLPDDSSYFWVGLFILLSAFIWQLGMLLHKPLEFQKKTRLMLFNNLAAFSVTYLLILIIYHFRLNYMYYALGVLTGSVVYALLSFFHLRKYLKSFH